MASAVFITDLSGKSIISRNYRGEVPLTKAIDRFAKYLNDTEDEAKKPVFHVDLNGDVMSPEDVGGTGPGGETFVYVGVSTKAAPSDERSTDDDHEIQCQVVLTNECTYSSVNCSTTTFTYVR
jgi:hypothetical protein